jgi:hypothetical protein
MFLKAKTAIKKLSEGQVHSCLSEWLNGLHSLNLSGHFGLIITKTGISIGSIINKPDNLYKHLSSKDDIEDMLYGPSLLWLALIQDELAVEEESYYDHLALYDLRIIRTKHNQFVVILESKPQEEEDKDEDEDPQNP